MKYRRTRTQRRTDALFLALNWYLTDQEDLAKADEYVDVADDGEAYTSEEVQAHLAKCYVGRFKSSRLRKKRAEDLYSLRQSQLMKKSRV